MVCADADEERLRVESLVALKCWRSLGASGPKQGPGPRELFSGPSFGAFFVLLRMTSPTVRTSCKHVAADRATAAFLFQSTIATDLCWVQSVRVGRRMCRWGFSGALAATAETVDTRLGRTFIPSVAMREQSWEKAHTHSSRRSRVSCPVVGASSPKSALVLHRHFKGYTDDTIW